MKRCYVFVMILCVLLLTPDLAAASYEMTWYTIDAGVQSTGGNYALSSAAGQPDAGVSSSGAYNLTGGFWSIVASVQEIFNYLLWTK